MTLIWQYLSIKIGHNYIDKRPHIFVQISHSIGATLVEEKLIDIFFEQKDEKKLLNQPKGNCLLLAVCTFLHLFVDDKLNNYTIQSKGN